MGNRKSEWGPSLVQGVCGAFLAALAAVGVQHWWWEINWWFIGVCAVFGFLFAWFVGEEAVEFLRDLLWRW